MALKFKNKSKGNQNLKVKKPRGPDHSPPRQIQPEHLTPATPKPRQGHHRIEVMPTYPQKTQSLQPGQTSNDTGKRPKNATLAVKDGLLSAQKSTNGFQKTVQRG